MGPEERDAEYVTQHDREVGDIMTRDIVSATPEPSISEIATLLVHHRIKRVPIISFKTVALLSVARILLRHSPDQAWKPLPAQGNKMLRSYAARLFAPRTGT
jgi:CBS domain-containing protein